MGISNKIICFTTLSTCKRFKIGIEDTNPDSVLNGNIDKFIEGAILRLKNNEKNNIHNFFISIVHIDHIFTLPKFFGYETSRFNDVIKSEIKNNEEIVLDFKKISLLLDIKKLTLFVKFINPNLDYKKTSIPLNSLRSDIDLEPILEKKIGIKRLVLSTNYLDINEIKPLVKKEYLNNETLKRITKGELKIKNLELNFDKNLNIKDNFIVNGKIKNINIQINNKQKIKNLLSDFSYKKNIINFKNASWSLNGFNKKAVIFNNSELSFKQKNKDYIVSLHLKQSK